MSVPISLQSIAAGATAFALLWPPFNKGLDASAQARYRRFALGMVLTALLAAGANFTIVHYHGHLRYVALDARQLFALLFLAPVLVAAAVSHFVANRDFLASRKVQVRFVFEIAIAGVLGLAGVSLVQAVSPEQEKTAILEALRLLGDEAGAQDAQRALAIAQSLSDSGSRHGAMLTGILMAQAPSPVVIDRVAAEAYIKLAADRGSLQGCRRSIRFDKDRMGSSLLKPALCGDENGQAYLGLKLTNDGYTGAQNPSYGVPFLEAAVSNGQPVAMHVLGRLYRHGNYVAKDKNRAIELFQKALDRGIAESGSELNRVNLEIRNGRLFQDGPEFFDACVKAAEMGDPGCQLTLSLAHETGNGERKSLVLAHKWANLNLNSNDDDEVERLIRPQRVRRLAELERKMSYAQIAEAERLASDWKPRKVERPQVTPLMEALTELRSELEGRLPARPKFSDSEIQSLTRIVGEMDTKTLVQSPENVVSTPPKPAPIVREFTGQLDNEPSPKLPPSNYFSNSTPSAPKEIAPPETSDRAKKLPGASEATELISQRLCGNVKKVRTSLAKQSGPIRGCKSLMRGGRSSLTVDNSQNDTAVLVKLYPANTQGTASLRVFTVKATDKWTESNIQPGSYELRYEDLASGGHSKTEALSISEEAVDGGIRFTNMRVTLYKVANGNMRTSSIAASEFND